MDAIQIHNLRASATIGVHPWEQKIAQPLLIDVDMQLDLNQCNNDLAKTVDYAHLTTEILSFFQSNSFHLIETAAEELIRYIKQLFPLISQVTLKLSKPSAIKEASHVAVRLTR